MSDMSLSFDPDLELTFNGDQAILSLTNEDSYNVVCKIHATAGTCYKINPSYFFVLPFVKVVVTININEVEDDDDCSDHEFIVQWWSLEEETTTDNAANYWKQNFKSHQKQIISKTFGCEFNSVCSSPMPNIAAMSINNLRLEKVDLDASIEHLGKIAIDSHTTMVQFIAEFHSVIEKMQATGTQHFNEIVAALRIIAENYKKLEVETRSTIRETTNVLSEVIHAATSNTLKPSDKIQLMKRDFDSLSKKFEALSGRHITIHEQLAVQAEIAELLKKENDKRVEKAEEMREHAQVFGVLGTPGVGLISSIAVISYSSADSVEQRTLKVLAGVGGALGGLVVGAAVTAGSPILLAIAAVLAVKSKIWSVKFENMHDMIRKLQEIMNTAAQYLSNISSDLDRLNSDTAKLNENESKEILKHAFGRIKRSCESAIENCNDYVQFVDENKRNMKRLRKPISN